MALRNDVKEEVSDEHSERLSEQNADANVADSEMHEDDKHAGQSANEDVDIVDADAEAYAEPDAADVDAENGEDDGEDVEQASENKGDYDPTFDQTLLKPLFERREKSLKELLESMDEFAPIIPDAVTDYYLARSGLKTNDQRIKRLLALATQKFISDITSDAYQYSRIRSQAGGTASTSGRGRGGQGGAGSGRTVLTMESLSGILGDYGINTKRPDFYR